MRRLKSIKSKILVIFLVLTFFQVGVMAVFTWYQLKPSIVDMYSEHLERFADVMLEEAVEETKKIETYMVNIIGDREIQNFLETAEEDMDGTQSISITPKLRNKILAYTEYDNIISGIYFMDNKGRIYSNLEKRRMQQFLNYHPELSVRKEASVLWYTENKNEDIIVYRIINNNTTDLTRKKGALCIFIDKKAFKERLDSLMMEENQHYIIKSSDYNFLLTSDKNAKIEQGDIAISWETKGWILKTWMNKDTAYAPIRMMTQILMAELLALLLFSIVLAVFLTGRITRPMRKIQDAMKKIGEGDIGVVVQDKDEDEMGALAATLNQMSLNMKKLMERIQEDEKQKRYLELQAMQYQITPHFLYNTLDAIAMSARKNKDYTSEKMTLALSEFFRINLSHGMDYVTLETEMRYVQTYLEIQSMRFPEAVTWDCMIDNNLKGVTVLKFILQPLVENSLYHGLRDAGRGGNINIHAYEDETYLYIEVKDDGIGMLPTRLEEVKRKMGEKQVTSGEGYVGGFGLRNVQQRLKLAYGTRSGLEVESEWEEGTCVTVILLRENRRKYEDKEGGNDIVKSD